MESNALDAEVLLCVTAYELDSDRAGENSRTRGVGFPSARLLTRAALLALQ